MTGPIACRQRTSAQKELDRRCRKRGISDRTRERIVRLNPDWHEGALVRGWHPAFTFGRLRWQGDYVSQGEFIRRFGRRAWRALPNGLKYKHGRRRYVGRNIVLDNLWKCWAGEIPPCDFMEWYSPPKAYANDPRLRIRIEYIPRAEFQKRIAP